MDIKQIKPFHSNPRKITGKMFDLLSSSLREFGDLSGVIVNVRTGEALGGNQRTAFFKQHPEDCKIEVKKLANPTKQGTVAYGHITYNGEQYSYREVDWDEEKSKQAVILANKVGGFWDNDILANEFDIESLKLAGFEDFELGFANEEIKLDQDKLSKEMSSYLDGNIKQIVLYFTNEEFDAVMPRMEKALAQMGVESHTEVFLKLLDLYERD